MAIKKTKLLKMVNSYCTDCGGDTIQEFNPTTNTLCCVVCGTDTSGDEIGSRAGNSRTSFYPLEE